MYKERQKQVEEKLEEVRAGKAAEYLQPLAVLQEDMRIATQVAGHYLLYWSNIFQRGDNLTKIF